jgi:hypothetical protein
MNFRRILYQEFASISLQIKNLHLLFILKKFACADIHPLNGHRINEMQLISDFITNQHLTHSPKFLCQLLRYYNKIVLTDFRNLNVPGKLFIRLTCLLINRYQFITKLHLARQQTLDEVNKLLSMLLILEEKINPVVFLLYLKKIIV